MKIFISGSRNIKKLNKVIYEKIDQYIDSGNLFLVGDAIGVDEVIQKYLLDKKYFNVEVYTVESKPRVIKSSKFKIIYIDGKNKKGREKQEIKDKIMTELADVLIVIWDGKSKGSYKNIIRGLKFNKKVEVFFNDEFLTDVSSENIRRIFYENHMFSISEYIKEFKVKITVKEIKDLLQKQGIIDKNKLLNNKAGIIEKNKYGKEVLKFSKDILDKVCGREKALF